jgi:hypothetical protein
MIYPVHNYLRYCASTGKLYIAYGISDLFPATMVSLNPIRIMKHQADEEKAEVNIPE